MNAIFSPDSKLMGGLSLLADMIVVNCLYLLCCIPIFTIGAARVALYCVGMCWARRESAGVKKYISVFISSIKSTFALWATVLLRGVFLIADCYLFLIADIPYESIGVCALVILTVLYLFVASQIFLLASQFDNSFKQTIANAFLISFAYPIRSIVHIILLVLPVVVFLFLPKVFVHAGLLWFLLYFSLEVYLDSLIIRPVYARLQTQKSE